ncbi:MAG: hypothetical protein KGI80_06030 [Verrucomicrobiota bacterium]|nr:hypothetical protein [Verrucomicrobiota bacterium]
MQSLIFLALIITSLLLGHEGGSFEDNQIRFASQHLPKLLDHESGRCLLLGTSGMVCSELRKQMPLVEFEEISLWDRHLWNKYVLEKDWRCKFDCIIAINILDRDQNRNQLIHIIFDLLKPEGKAVIYVDPQNKDAFTQRMEQSIRHSEWAKRIPIVPSLSLSEYQSIIERFGFCILDQSPDEYKIYFPDSFIAFLSVVWFVCPRWPVPRNEWDEEQFAGKMRDCLKSRWPIPEKKWDERQFIGETRDRLKWLEEECKVSEDFPRYKSWIEDVLPTHYFVVQKLF